MNVRYLALLLVVLAGAFCTSVERLADRGDLDRAYDRALRRVQRRVDRGKPPAGKALDDYLRAHDAIQRRDLRRTRHLEARPGTAKYAELYRRYRDLHARNHALGALHPDAALGPQATGALASAPLARARDRAQRRAGDHYLDRAAPLRRAARTGDKLAAREAFALVDSAAAFLPERAGELTRLRDTLRDLGTLRILVRGQGGGGDFAGVVDRVVRRRGGVRHAWTSVVVEAGGARVDLEALVRYEGHDESGPDESCSSTTYSEEVLDYVERETICEQVDDSTTVQRVVETEHFTTVYATVTECEQSAAVRATGSVTVYEPGGNAALRRIPLSECETWSHAYEVYEGDDRALPAGCVSSGSSEWPPSSGELLADAQIELAEAAYRALLREYAPRRRGPRLRRR